MLNMTPTDNLRAASTDHAIAVARWDDDGGVARIFSIGPQDDHAERSRAAAELADSRPGEIDEIPPPA
jgi:hypothetical protein